MEGTVAITDYGWYEYLASQPGIDEVNFWTPSAYWGFRAEIGSPFFFKLKKRYDNAICGFAFFSRFVRLPDWLAWDWFQTKNGCPDNDSMRQRIGDIRDRINVHGGNPNEIGCILLSQPTFFAPSEWIVGPFDWPPANLRNKKYSLLTGEGKRIWDECRARTAQQPLISAAAEPVVRYGTPQLVQPRLGQGIFRVAVMEAYGRSCAITKEHSLPALDASHIQPFSQNGPSAVSNGVLLRADMHRLFDQGYITITPEHRVEVSPRLKLDYQNGKTYYPYHGSSILLPEGEHERPAKAFLEYHNAKVYRAA